MDKITLCRIIYILTGQWQLSPAYLTQPVRLTRLVTLFIFNVLMALAMIAIVYAFFWVACFANDVCYQAQFIQVG